MRAAGGLEGLHHRRISGSPSRIVLDNLRASAPPTFSVITPAICDLDLTDGDLPQHHGHIAKEVSLSFVLTGLEAVRGIRSGLPVEQVDEAIRSGMVTATEIDQLAIPRKTLAHRRQVGRLSVEQSDRFVRMLRIIMMAEDVFANHQKAAAWLRRPNTGLDGEKPLHLLDTDAGAREVELLLGRIAHGLAA